MLSAFASAFRTPDLRNKILFTLLMIGLYRVGATLPSPGVSFGNVQKCLDIVESGADNQVFTLLNLFSGGALLQLSVFALGIMPYITASIILQLLTVVIPRPMRLRTRLAPGRGDSRSRRTSSGAVSGISGVSRGSVIRARAPL